MALVVLALVSLLLLLCTNTKNPLLVTMALALISAGTVCPYNILCPYAFETVPNEKGPVETSHPPSKEINFGFKLLVE
ncbi:hypothetical protein AGMMS49949_09290 [Alphaproteobacteria bacterium]|nr:hypothetical protein AGMMS49949_09290 [Alphaproteobacteria bacterium]